MMHVRIGKQLYRVTPKTFSLDTMNVSCTYKGAGVGPHVIGAVHVFFGPDPDFEQGDERLQLDLNTKEARVLARRLIEEANRAEGRGTRDCRNCGGRGYSEEGGPCLACEGEGTVAL